MADNTMELSPEFMAVAACPACHAKFGGDYGAHELGCTKQGGGLGYPLPGNIPVLLIDQARSTL